jgi:hypothetical protein
MLSGQRCRTVFDWGNSPQTAAADFRVGGCWVGSVYRRLARRLCCVARRLCGLACSMCGVVFGISTADCEKGE